MSGWLRKRSILGQLRIARQVQTLLASDLRTEIRARYPLEEVTRALQEYAANMTGGKILLVA